MEQLIAAAAKDGIWVLMFVAFFVYELKLNEKRDEKAEEREKNYQEVIRTLAEKFQIVCEIQEDIKCIKEKMNCKKG